MEMLKNNLKKLNKYYEDKDLEFVQDDGKIIIKEDFVIAKDKALKEDLKGRFGIVFDWDHKVWFIPKAKTVELKQKSIKLGTLEDLETLKENLKELLEKIENEELRKKVALVIKKNPEFYSVPGGKFHHHNYYAGLLEHSIQTAELALKQARVIEKTISLDKDLIIAGSVLHDIGKVNCYGITESNEIELKELNQKQGHIVNGIVMISREFNDYERVDDLVHIIASHHNLREWGSPVEPNSGEAWIVHVAEYLSSRILG